MSFSFKKLFDQIIIRYKSIRSKHFYNLLAKRYNQKSFEYEDLGPVDEIGKGDEYLKALKWAFENPRVKNIALTGPYGSGKSSIIETFLKHNPKIDNKSVRISMASFVESKNEEGNNQGKIRIKKKDIEQGILKQLFYKVPYSKIPQSRYRKLHRINITKIWGYLMTFSLIAFVAIFVFYPEGFADVAGKITSAGAKIYLPKNVSYLIFWGLYAIILELISRLYRSILSHLKLGEVRVSNIASLKNKETEKESVFNRKLDEIVYFFEETKYRYVFFEDLDRLDDASIFISLRELNVLLNNDDTIKKKPIIFVYAVRDDLFEREDRTKFFEFIVPVIPIINSTNSSEVFLAKIEKIKEKITRIDLDRKYIFDVSPYIEDMRILQNICNEFVDYRKILFTEQSLSLSDKEMLSLIIFKNLYPHDFADIQAEKGIIKQAFSDKKKCISDICSKWQERINSSDVLLENKRNEVAQNISDLKAAFMLAITEGRGFAKEIRFNRTTIHSSDVMTDNFILPEIVKVPASCNVIYYNFRGDQYNTAIDSEVFMSVYNSYRQRIEEFEHIQKIGTAKIKEEIEQLENKIEDTKKWTMESTIKELGIEAVLSEKVRMNDLLVFMLRRGYINENYANYINYFKEGTLTARDKNFILSVRNMKPLEFDYHLDNIEVIIEQLQLYEYEQKSIYNFELLEHKLEKYKDDQSVIILIRQLSDEDNQSWNFINRFIAYTSKKELFTKLLLSAWPNIWNYIIHRTHLSYDNMLYYLTLLLNEASEETLKAINNEDNLSIFIEENEDILQRLQTVSSAKLIKAISILNICFSKVNCEDVPNSIVDYIFTNNQYEINYFMIDQIVKYKNTDLRYDLKIQNYTTIIRLNFTPLINYINENITSYIMRIVFREQNTEEELTPILNLLEKAINDPKICIQLIDHENFKLDNLEKCCSSLITSNGDSVQIIWDELFRTEKIELSWDNIVCYWKHFSVTNNIISYIQKKTTALKCTKVANDDFIMDIISSNLSIEAFKNLLYSFDLKNYNLPYDVIEKQKVSVMIDSNFLPFDVSQFNDLKTNYPELCEKFIINNQEEYRKIKSDIQIDSVFEKLILNEKMLKNIKQEVLDEFGEKLMSEKTAKALASRKFGLSIKNIKIFDAVWNYLDVESRETFMFSNLDLLDDKNFELCFANLPSKYSKFRDRSKRHEIELTGTSKNMMLAKRLQEVGYITSFQKKSNQKAKDFEGDGSIVCRIKALK